MTIVLCSLCGQSCEKKFVSDNDVPFVCRTCRCVDCQIVLGSVCACGERHGEPSSEDSTVCEYCAELRKKIPNLDAEFAKVRELALKDEADLYDD